MYTYMDTLGSRTLNKQISLIIYRKDYHVSWIIRWKWPMEGDIGGYPIPQYRTKNLQIPKYRVENLRNTDTAFMIGDAYLTLYPSREFFFLFYFISSMYTPEINLSLREKTWEDLELIGTTIEKPGHWMSYQFHHRVTVRNCLFIYR